MGTRKVPSASGLWTGGRTPHGVLLENKMRLTHPMRDTICSTMCLLKVMITNSFCVTKKHTEKERVSYWTIRSLLGCWARQRVHHSWPAILNPPDDALTPDSLCQNPCWCGLKAAMTSKTFCHGGQKTKGLDRVTHQQHGTAGRYIKESVCLKNRWIEEQRNQRWCVTASEGILSGPITA